MAATLRLDEATREALRTEAERAGRSQQDIVRAALAQFLHLEGSATASATDDLLRSARAQAPRSPYRRARPRIRLPHGQTSLDLLDRDDRV